MPRTGWLKPAKTLAVKNQLSCGTKQLQKTHPKRTSASHSFCNFPANEMLQLADIYVTATHPAGREAEPRLGTICGPRHRSASRSAGLLPAAALRGGDGGSRARRASAGAVPGPPPPPLPRPSDVSAARQEGEMERQRRATPRWPRSD